MSSWSAFLRTIVELIRRRVGPRPSAPLFLRAPTAAVQRRTWGRAVGTRKGMATERDGGRCDGCRSDRFVEYAFE